jgi:hypothetical protein
MRKCSAEGATVKIAPAEAAAELRYALQMAATNNMTPIESVEQDGTTIYFTLFGSTFAFKVDESV